MAKVEFTLYRKNSSCEQLQVPLKGSLGYHQKFTRIAMASPRIAVTSTFTAEPIDRVLRYWCDLMEWNDQIEFAEFGQVFQELIAPQSLLRSTTAGCAVVLVRVEDWRHAGVSIKETTQEFVETVRNAASTSRVPYIVGVCPSAHYINPDLNSSTTRDRQEKPEKEYEHLSDLERELVDALTEVENVSAFGSDAISQWYLRELKDPSTVVNEQSDEIGSVPYTMSYYVALGTTIARKLNAQRHPGYKVIVLDCDNTLWDGVCGEVGPEGVKLEEHRLHLQRTMVDQTRNGRLIALCSKNTSSDVWDVFDRRNDMVLTKEHIVAAEISWRSKPVGLQKLAKTLNLGLESFLFIDDNEVECAAVRSACPEVTTLQVPKTPSDLRRMLNHIWGLDKNGATATDAKRTAFYQSNRKREAARRGAPSLAEFIDSLAIKITTRPVKLSDIPRVAQLTQRTNQFNATGLRFKKSELQQWLEEGDIWVTSVSDRFGDYGLVGVMFVTKERASWIVENFLLSCRAMGRGVEHSMLRALGRNAKAEGAHNIKLLVQPTAKNEPLRKFFNHLATSQTGRPGAEHDRYEVVSTTDKIAVLAPDWSANEAVTTSERATTPETPSQSSQAHAHRARTLEHIAQRLCTVDKIKTAATRFAGRQLRVDQAPYVAPRTDTERHVAELVESTLGVSRIGAGDNFFALGGNSLMGAILLGRIYDAYQVKLSLPTLFEHPTVGGLARAISMQILAEAHEEELTEQLESLQALSQEDIEALIRRGKNERAPDQEIK